MIENNFLMARSVIVNANPSVLKLGLINYLKELEQEWNDKIDEHLYECEDHECTIDMSSYDPWEIADSIFQYAFFSIRKEKYGEDVDKENTDNIDSKKNKLTEEEIEAEIQKFIDQLGSGEENDDE